MKSQPIISIDWDHTFRNMHGLDLNMLAVVCYAQAKNIAVGLTTHRDIENTTLYSLYHWQFQKPKNKEMALAAAIHYWQKYLFYPLEIKFDFINARYQPNYENSNYYEKILLPHELNLFLEIEQKNILQDQEAVKNKVVQHQKKEDSIQHNEFKGAQINWLIKHYENNFNGALYHIDDSQEVCDFLFEEFKKVNSECTKEIITVHYHHPPLFYNKHCSAFLEDIGLFAEWNRFLAHGCTPLPYSSNHFLYLSLCLLATQISYAQIDILEAIEKNLINVMPSAPDNFFCQFIFYLIAKIKEANQPVYFFLNEWAPVWKHK